MSMPTFPDSGIDLTKEQALHMLLGSIAMEELALSHIMNAEGEKLQYVLGTLPGEHGSCASTREILEVNDSISNLLEQVTHTQFLLKGKLAQVLKFIEPPTPPDPPCPCDDEECECGRTTCILHAPERALWDQGERLNWKPVFCQGGTFWWDECYPANLCLPPNKPVLLHYTFHLTLEEEAPVTLALQALKCGCWGTLQTFEAPASGTEVALSGSAVVHPTRCTPTPSPVAFALRAPGHVLVDWATLSLTEL